MKQDWKALAELTMDHMGATVGNTLTAGAIGLLLGVLLAVVLGKLGLFRRPANVWYNRLVKLYVPYLIVVCVMTGVQLGLYRSVRNAAIAANDAAIGALYEHALAPSLGTPEARQAFLVPLQEGGRTGQSLGKEITGAIKTMLRGPEGERNWTRSGAAMLAGWFIDRYEDDIASAILYGIYLKTSGSPQLHASGEPMDYRSFHEDVDFLLKADLGEMERTIKVNLGGLTHSLIERQYASMWKSASLFTVLMCLIPLLEWAGHTYWTRREHKAAHAPATEVLRDTHLT